MSYINRTIVVQSDSRYLTQRVTAMIAGYDQAMATIGGIQQAADRANAAADRAEDIAESVSGMVLSYADMQALRDSTNALTSGTTVSVRTNGAWKVAPAAATDTHFSRLDGVRFYEAGPIFTTRARMAQAVARGDLAEGDIRLVRNRRYQANPIGPDGLLALDLDYSGRLDMLQSRMADGQGITVACYGDSTTDGNGTTDWTANPTNTDGSAVGGAAHTPPFAWPAALQTILRRMYRNTGITIWNAGYGGRDVVTGWARRNFAQAIINNPAYGTPNILLINFGLNDMVRETFTVDLFFTELSYLLNLCDYYGIVPVLMTPDPVRQNTPRQGGSIVKLISVLQRAAQLYGIEMIDTHTALRKVLESSSSNALWSYQQPDGVHFGDLGHRVKASYVAARLFSKTLFPDSGAPAINVAPWSPHANTADKTYSMFDQANNRFGVSLNIAAGSYAPGDVLMEVWTWQEEPDRIAWWRSVDGDGYYQPRTVANAPSIEVADYFSSAVSNFTSPTSARSQGAGGRRGSEDAAYLAQLPVGLSCLRFIAPADNNTNPVFLGYFSIRKRVTELSSARFVPAGSGSYVVDPDVHERGDCLVSFGIGRTAHLFCDAVMPDGAGVGLISGRVFLSTDDTTPSLTIRRRALFLCRNGANAELRDVVYSTEGVISNTLLGSGAYAWSGSQNEFRVAMSVTGANEQLVQITSLAAPLGPIITVTRAATGEPLPAGGHPGAIFKDYGVSAAAGIARLTVFDVVMGLA
ncbi:hypothetical protein GL279_00460 [Paracoccus limosus]|uniref:SGNH hydrolase-type esterase domain-containing protein n=1 Tax=Paracoccus limosus TaxID=913252 RepID=A0A844H0V0_9RHOB|nr:SGNH/GDSL hydrolase family protein [Paracoccus limosus]MTH33070.1 hypothetical protein [Paracoccus limosus]